MSQRTIITIVALFSMIGTTEIRSDVAGVDVASTVYTGPGVLDPTPRGWTSAPNSGNWFWLDGRRIYLTFGSSANGGADATIDLFDNYKHNSGSGDFEVVITNLDIRLSYNLVIYGAQNFLGGRGGSFDLTEPNRPALSTTGDQQDSFEEGVNYVRHDDLTPDQSAGDARIRFLVGNGPEGIAIFNGFELESPARQYVFVVNADFPTGRALYNGPGVLNDAGTQWNNLGTHGVNLTESQGNTTSIETTLTGWNSSFHGQYGTVVNALTEDYCFDQDDNLTLTINNLLPGRKYDLALFGCQNGFGGRGSTFTISGHGSKTTTATFAGLNPDGFLEGNTHVLFYDVVADVGGAITVNITQEAANGVSFLNGFQIGQVRDTKVVEGTTIIIR